MRSFSCMRRLPTVLRRVVSSDENAEVSFVSSSSMYAGGTPRVRNGGQPCSGSRRWIRGRCLRAVGSASYRLGREGVDRARHAGMPVGISWHQLMPTDKTRRERQKSSTAADSVCVCVGTALRFITQHGRCMKRGLHLLVEHKPEARGAPGRVCGYHDRTRLILQSIPVHHDW